MLPVLIVGAGPAGLVTALMLQRHGVPFAVVERQSRDDVAGWPKAGSIDFRTVELLTAEGLAPDAIDFTVANSHCEFRSPQDSLLLDYGALTGNRPHFVYPQHLLVERLCSVALDRGADIRFERTVVSVDASGDAATVVVEGPDGSLEAIEAGYVVGCDGARSAVAPWLDEARVTEVQVPVRLLASIADAPPMVPHTIYGTHPNGFAGQMRRGPDQTRYYLEVSLDDGFDDWPVERMRSELENRLLADGRLDGVHFGDLSLVDLRVKITEPMQQGPLFLAGDAAHLITPAAGKGMNLAIGDAVELAHGLIEACSPAGSGSARLDAYSATRLQVIWRIQAFSYWFLHIMLANASHDTRLGDTPAALFGRGTRGGWINALRSDPHLRTWFAYNYAGVDA